MFVLILALLFLHLPTQSPSMIVCLGQGGHADFFFCFLSSFFFFTSSLRAENYGYLLLVSEPSNTPKRLTVAFKLTVSVSPALFWILWILWIHVQIGCASVGSCPQYRYSALRICTNE